MLQIDIRPTIGIDFNIYIFSIHNMCGIQHINTKRKHGKHIVTIYIFQARDGRGNGERIKKKHHNVVNEFESLILLQPFFLYNDYTVFISDPRIWGCDNERGYVSCTCVYIPIFVISVNELKSSSIHDEYKYKMISKLRKSYLYSINFNNILIISHITSQTFHFENNRTTNNTKHGLHLLLSTLKVLILDYCARMQIPHLHSRAKASFA